MNPEGMNQETSIRGRPKSEQKRQLIFKAGETLFLQHGFDNVSMDMVAEQAGVSKQTVYSHFRNKEELYQEIIASKCIANQLAAEFMHEDRPCEDMLLEIARRFSTLLLSKPAINVYRLSVGHAEQRPHIARLFYDAGPKYTIDIVAGYLAEQHAKGRLQIPDPHQAAMQLLYMLKGDAVMRAVLNIEDRPGEAEIDHYIKSCVAMFLRAYGTNVQK